MKTASSRIFCFGEVLWDVFPEHRRIGGAPLNVAVRLRSFGHEVYMISAVGNDEAGLKIKSFLHENEVNTTLLQQHPDLATGEVLVNLDQEGIATYQIVHPVAWDDIADRHEIHGKISSDDVLIYGSLACRDQRSYNTLKAIIPSAGYKAFDVNLRPPYYQFALLEELIKQADLVKFNDEELQEFCNYFKISGSTAQLMQEIAGRFNLTSICVTLGDKGAVLWHNNTYFSHPGFKIDVRDTVGAGDSFLATLLSELLLSNDPQRALTKACAMGALVAGREGANPVIEETVLFKFLQSTE